MPPKNKTKIVGKEKIIKLFYDVETTGINHNKSSIHQISAVMEINGQVVNFLKYNVRPHKKAYFDPEAMALTNADYDIMMTYPDMKLILKQFEDFLGTYIDKYNRKEKAFLVGFNNRKFDDQFLRKWFELCGNNFFGSWFWSNSIDVSVSASEYLIDRRHHMKNFKLKTVAKELGIPVDDDKLHESDYDIELTRTIYRIVTGEIEEPLF